jgi:hypothetical protein
VFSILSSRARCPMLYRTNFARLLNFHDSRCSTVMFYHMSLPAHFETTGLSTHSWLCRKHIDFCYRNDRRPDFTRSIPCDHMIRMRARPTSLFIQASTTSRYGAFLPAESTPAIDMASSRRAGSDCQGWRHFIAPFARSRCRLRDRRDVSRPQR